jgi:DNA repair protein RecO (recombination protein O)
MIPHSYTLEGFILGRRDFGEADRILDIYSKEKGKISLIAKGIRRPGSRKRGHLEIFSKIKFQMTNSRGLGLMMEVEILDDFKEIRQSIKRISLAYYFMEVLNKSTHEGDVNIEVFDLFCDFMEKLKSTNGLKQLRASFVTNLLKTLGYWPKDKDLIFPDKKLDEVLERQIYSKRVGKIMLK